MEDIVYGAAAEFVEIAAYALVTGLLTAAGLFAEITGFTSLMAGDPMLGAWLAYMGLLAIYAGLFETGYRRLRPALVRWAAR